jgi:hypothetical protein
MAETDAKNRKPHTIEELQHASLAVQYEMFTLATTHEMLQKLSAHWGSPPQDQAMSNAILHSFLLAARNLLHFLYAHNPRPTDIIAEDFFADPYRWTKQRVVPEPEMANGELVKVISKRLAHLTWDRVGPTKPLWGAFRIVWNVGLGMQSFLQLADQAHIHPQLREDVAAIMALLKAQLDQSGIGPAMMAPARDLMVFDDTGFFARPGRSDGER